MTYTALTLVLTAREFKTTRKSVISAPAWLPTPRPAVPIALGADHAVASGERASGGEAYHDSHPSSSLAITTPDPARAENKKPALKMVKMAKPFAF